MSSFRNVKGASVGLLLALTSVACLGQAGQTYRQQQQQNYQYPAPSARYYSDLVHSASSVDLPIPSFKSLSHKLANQENQISEKPGLQQQHNHKSGQQRTVINGNHATYVEPPANFKPIIYEHSQATAARHQPNEPSATSNGDSFIESPNHLVASMLPPGQGSSRQQQKRQTQASVAGQPNEQQQVFGDTQKPSYQPEQQQNGDSSQNGSPLETNNNSNNADEGDAEPNSLPLKPSIDRWSDWTDMSVDPDLASSETQQSPLSSLPAPSMVQVNQRPQHQSQERMERAHRISTHYEQQRKQNGGVQLTSSQSDELTSVQILPLINQLYQQQQEHQQRMFVANLIKMQQSPVFDPAASYESKRDYFYQATQPHNFNSASQLNAGGNFHQHYHSYQRPSAPQNMPVFFYAPQQQPSAQKARPSFALVSFAPPAEPLGMPQKLQQSWRQSAAPHHEQAIGKRTTNLFKATAHENHYHPELMAADFHPERTSKFRPANAEAKLVNEQQKIQRRDYRLSAPLVLTPQPQELSSGAANTNKQVSIIGGGGQAGATSRVLTPQGGNLVNQVRSSRPASTATAAQATASAGVPSAAAASATQLSSNTTSNISSLSPKRVIKRHRIKTLLPVGLSSWLLGGIRDLDARHWKLPNEIMSKLAINDVDLQHPEQANQPTAAPADDSNSVVNFSNQVQTGGSLERADLPRPNAIRTPSGQATPASPR